MRPAVFTLLRCSRAALLLALLAALLQASLTVQSGRHEIWRALYGPGAALQICSAAGTFEGLLAAAPVDPATGEPRTQPWCAVCAAAAAVPLQAAPAAQPLYAEALAYVLPPLAAVAVPSHAAHIRPPARAPPVLS